MGYALEIINPVTHMDPDIFGREFKKIIFMCPFPGSVNT